MTSSKTIERVNGAAYAGLQVRLADHLRATGLPGPARRRYRLVACAAEPATQSSALRMRALNSLALLAMGRPAPGEAERWQRQALELAEQLCDGWSEPTATCLNNLAEIRRQGGDQLSIEPLLRAALDLRLRLLGNDHPELVSSLNNLAETYREKGSPEAADLLYRWALAILDKAEAGSSAARATVLNNLGLSLADRNEYSEALSAYRLALDCLESANQPGQCAIAVVLNNLGLALQASGHPALAKTLFRRAIDSIPWNDDSPHPELGLYWSNLALLLIEQGGREEAVVACHTATEIIGGDLGPSLPVCQQAWRNLEQCYAALDDEPRRRHAQKRVSGVFSAERGRPN